ncbi:TonB-dependent copper receptor [Neisseria perflava]|uniref:TonB-dependent copper receptor n=1 Tax=Neisseria perflava TaxID=33053 RepID=A0A9X7F6R3_NEIPE|nr:TonB-dependent copper receptor [Neisseria perflava]PLA49295.1 TonB-dependent copper receptor [Neisseria perflava]WOS98285.1 TonB-dependent copper receptor [Neisseria perflava]
MKYPPLLILPIALAVSQAWADTDPTPEETVTLSPVTVTVTGTQQEKANRVTFNPKAALQPLPAGDGADLLQSVPNMSIIRKGGSSGDPLFRGLGGSRLSVNADDQFIYGGCGMRMDPPTAYIHPNSFDKVVVTKGPQTVTQGMGLVSGSVQFIRKDPDFTEKPYNINATLTAGSNDRLDGSLEAEFGGKYGYVRTNISHNKADDYKDGDGNRIHSNFKRDSQMLQLGVTPTENTTIAGTYERSRAKVAYADRMMDGSKFDRDAWNIRFTQRNLTPWFSELELRYGKSEIDHVMDTYSLRTIYNPAGKQIKNANNPKRNTDTGRLKATFDWDKLNLQTGLDYLDDVHVARHERGGDGYSHKPYMPNQSFKQWGIFTEASWQQTDNQRWVAGLRHDQVKAHYDTARVTDPVLKHQKFNLNSGFLRWERNTDNGLKYYAGFGIAERAPDYWERLRSENKAIRAEQNRQIDAGVIWKRPNLHASVSVFGSNIKDFIMMERQGMMNFNVRNINASRFGGEAEVKWTFAPNWEVGTSLAYTHGKNRTDGKPLAQTPPLEWNNTLAFDNGKFSAGALWRVVAKQNRYSKGQGNIVGQDIGASSGFGVLSLNAGWKFSKYATLQGGVDNVFNKTYAEFVSRGGDPSAGTQTMRVNEPGRTAWLRLQAKF